LEIDKVDIKTWHHSMTNVFSRAGSLAVPAAPFVYLQLPFQLQNYMKQWIWQIISQSLKSWHKISNLFISIVLCKNRL